MVYEFSFDGKSLWALFGGSAVLGFLLFLAGILLGANWKTADEAAAATPAAPPAAAQPAAATPSAPPAGVAYAPARPYAPPQEPVVYDWPEARGYPAQAYAAQGPAGRAPEPADYGAQQRHAAAPAAAAVARDVAAPPVNFAREAARLSAAGIDADPRLVSEADAGAAGSPSPASFSVQVGAYVEEAEARRLVEELEHKGYTPSVFSGHDAEGRAWHAVRIGAYASQREAGRAADNFTRQERLKAVVRPFNSM